jgi:GNAT superfamily N-acetyltransferase
MNSPLRIRRARPEDQRAFYAICLQTSDNGADGSHLHDDPDALGNIYVGPYLKLEPDFALALEDDQGVCGYCLGTPDSARFYRRFITEWLPPVQSKLRPPAGGPTRWTLTEQLHHLLLHPAPLTYFPPEFAAWPAHLHIDLLPRAQGQGWGRRMLEQQMAALRATGAPGVHLCVAPGNARALAFYRKLGFTDLPAGPDTPPDSVFLGRPL